MPWPRSSILSRIRSTSHLKCAGLSRSLDLWATARLAPLLAALACILLTQKSSDPHRPPQSVCCTFKISILPKVLIRWEIYFFTLLHIAFFVLKQQGYTMFMLAEDSNGPWAFPLQFSAISIPSGLMSLLLVFFNGQCYTRYVNLYQACTAMGGSVQELAQLSATHAMATPDARWDATRYLLASVMMVYMKVTDIAASRSPTIDPEDWERLTQSEEEWLNGSTGGAGKGGGPIKAPPILLPHEVVVLKQCKGNESQVLQIWCLDAMWKVPERPSLKLRNAFRQHAVHALSLRCTSQAAESRVLLSLHWQAYQYSGAQHSFFQIEETVLNCRRATAGIPNILNNPIPFPYYHALVALMWTNYTLYAVTFLELESWLTPVAMVRSPHPARLPVSRNNDSIGLLAAPRRLAAMNAS